MDVRSRNRGAANRSRSNRVVGSISLGRAKARGVRQLLNDTEALKERAGTVMPGPIPALTTSMTGNMPAQAQAIFFRRRHQARRPPQAIC